ncbi:MAG: hypothetical protein QG656_2038, partial [Candidatus Hydrogenedentes bacterium]|nr:hypothetical protein [Candidatus Hydrogenedentota bacterium]
RAVTDRPAGVQMFPRYYMSAGAYQKTNPEEGAVQDFYGHDMMESNVPVRIVDMTNRLQEVFQAGPTLPVLGLDISTNRSDATVLTGLGGAGGPGTLTVAGANWTANDYAGDWLVDSGYETFEIVGNTATQLQLLSGTPRDGAWLIVKDPTFLEQVLVEFYNEGTDDNRFSLTHDLLPLNIDQSASGVALYRDNDMNPSNRNGVFDPDIDIPLRLDGPPVLIGGVGEPDTQVKFVFSSPGTDNWPDAIADQPRRRQWAPDSFGLLQNDPFTGPDFFVVVRASSKMEAGDDFRVGIVSWGPNTPTEPDPDTFVYPAPPMQDPGEGDIFSEFPWGARGLGFITFFSEAPTQYFMDDLAAKQRQDNSGFNWIRSTSSQKKQTNVVKAKELPVGPYSLRIESVNRSTLPATIPADQPFHLIIQGLGFGTTPTVIVSGYTATVASATDTAIDIVLANTPGIVPQEPVVLIVRNPATGSERSRDDLFIISTAAPETMPSVTGVTPARGGRDVFPVTVTGQQFNTLPQLVVMFGETTMPIRTVAEDGTWVQVDFPVGGLPATGALNVTVRNYTKSDFSRFTEDTLLNGFYYENLPSRPKPGCFGGTLGDAPTLPLDGDAAGDTLLVLFALLTLWAGAKAQKGARLVQAQLRRGLLAGLCILLVAGVTAPAYAFFPIGGFGEVDMKLKYALWPLSYMDINGDGDVSGPDEGIELIVESGDNGFTSDEIVIVKDSFKVWQDIPTCFIGFHYTNTVSDPFDFATAITGLEIVNFVAMETADDVNTLGLDAGVLGVTLLTFLIDDVNSPADVNPDDIVPEPYPAKDGGEKQAYGFPITGGQIIKADIVINAEMHRTPVVGGVPVWGTEGLADLKSTVVHEVGHMIGLTHTALNNLGVVGDIYDAITSIEDVPLLVESPAFSQRDATGQLVKVGVTPTMWPFYFFVDNGTGDLVGGWQDLAPDDIAGASFLYPRGSQDAFFSLTHWARTQTRADFPSLPIGGAHVVAWVAADNDPATSRVPLISTMTGMYEPELQVYFNGRFMLHGLLKDIETLGGTTPFPATYTITLNPINGTDITRMAPPNFTPDELHSIRGSNTSYNTNFLSEVFHETGNLLDMANKDVGTPLMYDRERAQIVSADSEKALAVILPGEAPMFGDTIQMCPWNVLMAGVKTNNLSNGLRALRDNVLVKTALGAAIVDTYYSLAPGAASFLMRHSYVLAVAHACGAGLEWTYNHYKAFAGAMLACAAFLALLSRRRAR